MPRSKMSKIDESCSTEFERISSRPGIPASDCSSGMVTSDSTSVADRPKAGVWTSTRGGANSGNTSTWCICELLQPEEHQPAGERHDNKPVLQRLEPTNHLNMSDPPTSPRRIRRHTTRAPRQSRPPTQRPARWRRTPARLLQSRAISPCADTPMALGWRKPNTCRPR